MRGRSWHPVGPDDCVQVTNRLSDDTEGVLQEWEIEADEQWMAVHQARMDRLFAVCEAIAGRLGVPDGMVY